MFLSILGLVLLEICQGFIWEILAQEKSGWAVFSDHGKCKLLDVCLLEFPNKNNRGWPVSRRGREKLDLSCPFTSPTVIWPLLSETPSEANQLPGDGRGHSNSFSSCHISLPFSDTIQASQLPGKGKRTEQLLLA